MAAQVSSITLDKPALERFCRRHHIVRLSLFGSAVGGGNYGHRATSTSWLSMKRDIVPAW